MKHIVFLFRDIHEFGKKVLLDNECEIVISNSEDYEKCRPLLQDAEAILTRNECINKDIMDMAPRLKVIAKHGVGYDNIDVAYATSKNIQVVYAPKGNINSVADMAMLHILACARKLRLSQDEFVQGNYDIRFQLDDTCELRDKTLGLIGCGNIAREVAKRAAFGFGMNVIGYDPYVSENSEVPISLVASRDEVFSRADFISLHLPAVKETIHSVGLREFHLMKQSAYLINTSRGNVVNEKELISALELHEIAGCGLDVFEHEPLSKEYILLKMKNVTVTPHCSGLTVQASQNNATTVAQGIVDVLNHQKPEFPVNKI